MRKSTNRRFAVLAGLAGGACLLQTAGCQIMPLFFETIVSNFALAAISQVANVLFNNLFAVA